MQKNQYIKGFTLVELAIAIVIIGLIVGGVLGGSSLIQSAKRQEIIKNLTSYETAINAFNLEYSALPGDFSEAEDYWGAANTDNGNGDKSVNGQAEAIDLWNHLGLAEIVPGDFDHTATTFINGTSAPDSGSQFKYVIADPCGEIGCDDAGTWTNNYLKINPLTAIIGNFEYLGDIEDNEFSSVMTGLSNKDVKSIDKKIDNDNPLSGKVMAPICTMANKDISGSGGDFQDATNADFNTTYLLTEDDKNCFFFYAMNN